MVTDTKSIICHISNCIISMGARTLSNEGPSGNSGNGLLIGKLASGLLGVE